MADLPRHPDSGTDREPAAPTRRWIPLVGIVAGLALVALFVVLHLTGVVGPGAS